ncbi:MAG: hypothetical protein HQM09_13015 [Candidatus Riflebacteria bacterium]|nr:hypothetical protein [Candidatus Riflebacteria bacterium]
MNQRDKAVWVRLLSLVGILLVIIPSLIWLPPAIQEKRRIRALQANMADQLTEQARAAKLLDDVRQGTTDFMAAASRTRKLLDTLRFTPRTESEIPPFIEDIQKLFGSPGLNLKQLAYQKRVKDKGFVTFAFEGQFRAEYQAFQALLAAFEGHPSGVRIETLEFLNLDDESHLIFFKLLCKARFAESAFEVPGGSSGR